MTAARSWNPDAPEAVFSNPRYDRTQASWLIIL